MGKLSDYNAALKLKEVNTDLGGKGILGSPSYIKLVTLAGVDYYLFVSVAGALRISTTLPTTDADGSVV